MYIHPQQAREGFLKNSIFMESIKKNPFLWLLRYMRESKEELRKVTWPSKQEITKYTIIIIVLSLIIAGFFGGLDWLLNLGLDLLISFTS